MKITKKDILREENIIFEKHDLKTIRKDFGEWLADELWNSCGYFDHFDTMDKLWYAYLMHENHFIIWDDDKKIWRRRIVMW